MLAVLAYFALWLVVPRATFLPVLVGKLTKALPFLSHDTAQAVSLFATALVAAPTVAFMAVQIAILYYFAALKLDLRRGLLTLALCLGCIAALLTIAVWQSGLAAKLGHYPSLKQQLLLIGYYNGPLKLPYVLLVMLAAASVGHLVSLRVTDKNLLLPVVMLAAYVDFWTVTRGPVATMISRAPDVVSAVSAPIPQAGTGAFMPLTLIGPGDFLFMGLVFAAVHRLKMDGARNYWFMFVCMTLGMLAVMFGLLPSLPALIALAIAVILANRREFHLSRQEKISTAIVAVLLVFSLPLVWSVLRPHSPQNSPRSQAARQKVR